MRTKYFFKGLWVICMLLSACGYPTGKPLPTETPTLTATATLTMIPTMAPTVTSTPLPVPTPTPDAKAMIAWRELNLPDTAAALAPSMIGIQEGAHAFSLSTGGGSRTQYSIASSFLFIDDMENPQQLVYGYTVLLPMASDQASFDFMVTTFFADFFAEAFGIPTTSIYYLDQTDTIGDSSKGVTAERTVNGTQMEYSMVGFRVGGIGSLVIIRRPANTESPIDIGQVARVYAASIRTPEKPCQISSVTPVEGSNGPTFSFEAVGFYPQEGRYITLTGPIVINGKADTAMTGKMGGGGENVDANGYLQEEISFLSVEQLAAQGMEPPAGSGEYTLTVGGYASGCEATQTFTWPEE
jgi:hypothetical protein